MTKHEEQEWETEEVEPPKNVGVVISVRFPRELAERIYDIAERRGHPVSAVVREAVEEYLSTSGGVPATTDIRIFGEGAVTLIAGHSSRGRTLGAPTDFVDRKESQLTHG